MVKLTKLMGIMAIGLLLIANLGFAAGVNYAIKYLLNGCTVYDYLILINNDASAPPGMVNKLYQPHLASNSGLLIAPSIKFNGHILPGTWYHRFTGLTLHKQVPGSFQYLSGCCLLIPNSEVRENLFDEDFFMYGEDVQLSWMLQKLELGIMFYLARGCKFSLHPTPSIA